MKTYTGTIKTGIVLTNPTTQNPATLAAGGYVTNTTTLDHGDAVYGNNAAAWNFTNYGIINGTASAGIYLVAGGTITNGATGTPSARISGGYYGVKIAGATGSVSNFGTIRGTSDVGIYLTGGTVSNARGALISGLSTGVALYGTAGTVSNLGTIVGTDGDAIYLTSGTVVNGATNATSALISGGYG